MYREGEPRDYEAVASFSNLNNQREQGIWCKTEEDWTAERSMNFVNRWEERGNVVTTTNEEDGQVRSFFAGYEYRNSIVFMVGVVDPRLPNYFDVWREDTAKLFNDAINRGNEMIRIRLSEDGCELVDWMENEIGMTKHPRRFIWKISAEDVQPYIDKYKSE